MSRFAPGGPPHSKRWRGVLCTTSGTHGKAQGKPTAKLTEALATRRKYHLRGSTSKALGHPFSVMERAKTHSKSFFTSVLNFHKMSNLLIYQIWYRNCNYSDWFETRNTSKWRLLDFLPEGHPTQKDGGECFAPCQGRTGRHRASPQRSWQRPHQRIANMISVDLLWRL